MIKVKLKVVDQTVRGLTIRLRLSHTVRRHSKSIKTQKSQEIHVKSVVTIRTRYTNARACVLAALMFGIAPAFAQGTAAEMAAYPMPPVRGFATTKQFQYVGDYAYPLLSEYATYGVNTGSDEYAYQRLTGVAGKSVNIWPRLANPVSDSGCFHTHLSYGVWTEHSVAVIVRDDVTAGGKPVFHREKRKFYRFVGGGGMSGVLNAQGKCEMKTENPLTAIDPRFGWGTDFTSFIVPTHSDIKAVIVGATAPTHGTGTCTPTNGFLACFEPIYMNVWTLPP